MSFSLNQWPQAKQFLLSLKAHKKHSAIIAADFHNSFKKIKGF